jgi:DNA-directed RNA polymerase subunit RPC12/RpoP
MYKQYECDACDAKFKLKLQIEDDNYQVYFCPYCSGEIEEEREEEIDDDE